MQRNGPWQETGELLARFRQHLRDNRMAAWRALSESEQMEVVNCAFNSATQIDLQRFSKIAHWRGDGDIFMSMPEWAMLIWERRGDG